MKWFLSYYSQLEVKEEALIYLEFYYILVTGNLREKKYITLQPKQVLVLRKAKTGY